VVGGRFFSDEADNRIWCCRVTTIDDFCKRAPALLRPDAPLTWGLSDDEMNSKAQMIPAGVVPKPAAVLVGVLENAGPSLLLTQRHGSLSNHAGQIAFPGGRMDVGETPLQAALREAEEETGLDRKFVEPLGFLDGYLTVTGYFIVPVVARILPGYKLTPQVDEVDDIFDVPLSFLLDSHNRETQSRDWKGMTRYYYVYTYGTRYIWGATAGMIKNLSDRFQNANA
jgi:8-oxo-dGTP pyrophosphatase MutT (NUDIX family)